MQLLHFLIRAMTAPITSCDVKKIILRIQERGHWQTFVVDHASPKSYFIAEVPGFDDSHTYNTNSILHAFGLKSCAGNSSELTHVHKWAYILNILKFLHIHTHTEDAVAANTRGCEKLTTLAVKYIRKQTLSCPHTHKHTSACIKHEKTHGNIHTHTYTNTHHQQPTHSIRGGKPEREYPYKLGDFTEREQQSIQQQKPPPELCSISTNSTHIHSHMRRAHEHPNPPSFHFRHERIKAFVRRPLARWTRERSAYVLWCSCVCTTQSGDTAVCEHRRRIWLLLCACPQPP